MNQPPGERQSTDSWNSPVVYLIAVLLPAAYALLYFSTIAAEPAGHETLRFDVASARAVAVAALPPAAAVDRRKADLGRALFFDTRLSEGGDISCAHCHDIAVGGADGRATSIGAYGRTAKRNAPTVFNALSGLALGRDGRNPTLKDQIDDHVSSPWALASSWPAIVERLSETNEYRERFATLYATGITTDGIRDALDAFQRTLVTPNARFDRFLQGDDQAFGVVEKEGYRLFTSVGCIACHQGHSIGGNLYQKLGLIHPYEAADAGRVDVTGNDADRHVFKVPSLRNVALTAPYLHDGSIATLEQAVALMAYHQLGRRLSETEVQAIVAFLETLTGDVPS